MGDFFDNASGLSTSHQNLKRIKKFQQTLEHIHICGLSTIRPKSRQQFSFIPPPQSEKVSIGSEPSPPKSAIVCVF